MNSLPEKIKNKWIDILSREKAVEQAILFGSRARGDARANSDIDLALLGCEIPIHIHTKLREAAGLYQVDIVRLNELDNKDLIESIERDGIVIYAREDASAFVH